MRKIVDVLDTVFKDYKEGLTIAIDYQTNKHFELAFEAIHLIENNDYLNEHYHKFLDSRMIYSLHKDHDQINYIYYAIRGNMLAELFEVRRDFKLKKDFDEVDTYTLGLLSQLDKDIIKIREKKGIKSDPKSFPSGNYQITYSEKRIVVITSPTNKFYKFKKYTFDSKKDNIFLKFIQNPNKKFSKEELQIEETHKFINNLGFKGILADIFFLELDEKTFGLLEEFKEKALKLDILFSEDDPVIKRDILNSTVSDSKIENGEIAVVSFKTLYENIAIAGKTRDFEIWRRVRD